MTAPQVTSHTPPPAPQTMAERILSRRGGGTFYAGDLAVVEVDQVMVVDSIAQSFIERMQRDLAAVPKYPERVSIVIDHVAPASTVSVAQAQKEAREYAAQTGVRLFDVGRGICHQVLMEEGLAQPGWIVLGSDSHSTTYGAVAAFGSGMGATDIALAAASGKTWLRVPESVKSNPAGRVAARRRREGRGAGNDRPPRRGRSHLPERGDSRRGPLHARRADDPGEPLR